MFLSGRSLHNAGKLGWFAGAACLWCAACLVAQEQYPKPLIHAPDNHPAQRVLLLDVAGLDAMDLATWIDEHPHSALADLSLRGVMFTNAHMPWADPAAGIMAIATGGTPISTGILSADGYDHALSPPGSLCAGRGAPIVLDAMLDMDGEVNPNGAPLDPDHGCLPMLPHNLVRTNTIFEVIHGEGGRTAWAGPDAALTDLLRGPSGLGIDESCGVPRPVKTAPHRNDLGDEARVDALLHWIDGNNCSGSQDAAVPTLFGMSFIALRAAEQNDSGYVNLTGRPSAAMSTALKMVDGEIGRIIQRLREKHLYNTTWIFVTSTAVRTSMGGRSLHEIALARLVASADSIGTKAVVHMSGGHGAMIWLKDPSLTGAVVDSFARQSYSLGIRTIRSGVNLGLTLNLPSQDSRMPDIILTPKEGVVWGTSSDGLGGTTDVSTHVALLVAGAQLAGRVDKTWVPTTQLPALLLRALGIDKFDLRALHEEHSPALPGIF